MVREVGPIEAAPRHEVDAPAVAEREHAIAGQSPAASQERQEGGAPVGRQGLRGSMAACCRADGTPASSACGLRPFAMRERRRASQPFVAPAVQPP